MHVLPRAALSLLAIVVIDLAAPRPAAAGSYTFTTLATFNGANGANPQGTLASDAQGNLFGTTVGVTPDGGTVFELASRSGTITTLASFNGANGANPSSNLILDAQGNLYGTALRGGPGNLGTVFELASGSNTITTLGTLVNANGNQPHDLVRDGQGNLYGTTYNTGIVFEVAAGSSTITTLATFNGANGTEPIGSLVRDAQGNLFGVTNSGGANDFGTVFELAAGSGTLTTLASFDAASGLYPIGGLILDAEGNLFGTTAGTLGVSFGTVFELSPVPEPTSLVLLVMGLVGLATLALTPCERRFAKMVE
jgi:uncharacterized repeat protein (TIGR03803 family)